MTSRLQRRAFLQAVLSCVAVLPAATSIGCSSESLDEGSSSRLRTRGSREELVLADYFDDAQLDAAAFVGRRYLAVAAPNASTAEISALIAPTVELLTESASEAAALAALRTKILADFATEATIPVDGWIFSVTELHVCVLVGTLIA